jgi:hypothetical protein
MNTTFMILTFLKAGNLTFFDPYLLDSTLSDFLVSPAKTKRERAFQSSSVSLAFHMCLFVRSWSRE